MSLAVTVIQRFNENVCFREFWYNLTALLKLHHLGCSAIVTTMETGNWNKHKTKHIIN